MLKRIKGDLHNHNFYDHIFFETSVDSKILNAFVGHILPTQQIRDHLNPVEYSQVSFMYRYEFHTRFFAENKMFFGMLLLKSPTSEWDGEEFRTITNESLIHFVSCFTEDLLFLSRGYILQWSEGVYRSKFSPFFHAHIYSSVDDLQPEKVSSENSLPQVLQHAAYFSGADVLVQSTNDHCPSPQPIFLRLVSRELDGQVVQIIRSNDSYVISYREGSEDDIIWWWNHEGDDELFLITRIDGEEEANDQRQDGEEIFALRLLKQSKYLCCQEQFPLQQQQHQQNHGKRIIYQLKLTGNISEATRFAGRFYSSPKGSSLMSVKMKLPSHSSSSTTTSSSSFHYMTSLLTHFNLSREPKCWHKHDAEHFHPRHDILPQNYSDEETSSFLCDHLHCQLIPHPRFPLHILTLELPLSSSSPPTTTNHSHGRYPHNNSSSSSINFLSTLKIIRTLTQRIKSILFHHKFIGYNIYLRLWKLIHEEPKSLLTWTKEEMDILYYQNLSLDEIILPENHVIVGYFEFDPQSQYMLMKYEGYDSEIWVKSYKSTNSYFYCL